MVQGVVLLAIFVAFVFMGNRWQQQRRRNQTVVNELATQVGKRGVVTESVDTNGGLVRINGEGYAACTQDGSRIGPRVMVLVVAVHRYRLAVARMEGHGRLVDIDTVTGGEEPHP
jgi:membrane protein implicated in regulation of membrane protease activity